MALTNVEYLVIHTAAADIADVDAARIDEWHKARGWNGIGYHYFIVDGRHAEKADGLVEEGRSLATVGAHARGINSRSVGICCGGHGDVRDLTEAQKASLTGLLATLSARFRVAAGNIIGHREINQLIDRGLISDMYRTGKTCPGTRIDMEAIRSAAERHAADQGVAGNGTGADDAGADAAEEVATETIRKAVDALDGNLGRFPNAADEWADFRGHPEVRRFLED